MGTIFDREHEPPKAEDTDLVHEVVRDIVGVIPGIGPLLDRIIAPPMTRRLDEWREDVADALRRLAEQRGVNIADLQKNEEFADAVMLATQSALRTSQAGKRNALLNAVLNTALPNGLDVTRQQVFLSLTDRFTDRHLILLALFHSPKSWQPPDGKPLQLGAGATGINLLNEALPEAIDDGGLYKQLWSDLYAAGLVKTSEVDNGAEGPILEIQRTTDHGKKYIDFITSPLSE